MTQFVTRFKKLTEDAGLNIEQIAKLLGVSKITAEGLTTGYISPNMDILKRIAQIFNVSLKYMALLSDDPKCEEDPFLKEVYVVDSVSGADGEILKDDIVGTIYMNADTMHGKEYMATVVHDNSMSRARVCKGDTALICCQRNAVDGDIVYCVLDDGETLLRRYQRIGNIVILTAEGDKVDNPIIKIDTAETPFVIIGVVKEIRINFK